MHDFHNIFLFQSGWAKGGIIVEKSMANEKRNHDHVLKLKIFIYFFSWVGAHDLQKSVFILNTYFQNQRRNELTLPPTF